MAAGVMAVGAMAVRGMVVALLLGGAALAVSGESLAAPAGATIGELVFSEEVTERAEPVNPRIDFGSDTERVWVSFEYRDVEPGASVSYLVRANDRDFRFGRLQCCGGRNGRFAFAIEGQRRGDLGGAAYEVFIYFDDVEVGRGCFGIHGTQSFDNDNGDDDGDVDNDND